MVAVAMGKVVVAQVVDPAEPQYFEPVYVRHDPNPYVQWRAAQVTFDGTTIVVRIQGLRCSDLCTPSPISDVLLGRFPTGTYKVLISFDDDAATSQSFTVQGPRNASILVDYSGMWWRPAESGWGLSVAQGAKGNVFAVWFVYDAADKPVWYTLQGELAGSPPQVAGTVYKTTGPYFGNPYNPSLVQYAVAGTGSISFRGSNFAEFTYVVDGVSGTKQLTRQAIE